MLAMFVVDIFRVPTRTGKTGKMGWHFPVREKSGNFEQVPWVPTYSSSIMAPCDKQLALGLAMLVGWPFASVAKGKCTEQLEWFTCHRFWVS